MNYFQYNDGGRAEAGFKGKAGDCVCRAIAITTGIPYRQVFDSIENWAYRATNRNKNLDKNDVAIIEAQFKPFVEYMLELGFNWVPVLSPDKKCKKHLHPEELPKGKLIVHVSGHVVAMIDGVIHDTFDPSRFGKRCVYGYWVLNNNKEKINES